MRTGLIAESVILTTLLAAAIGLIAACRTGSSTWLFVAAIVGPLAGLVTQLIAAAAEDRLRALDAAPGRCDTRAHVVSTKPDDAAGWKDRR